MVGGCYALRSEGGSYIVRTPDGFAATGQGGDTATWTFTFEGTLDSWKAKKEQLHGYGPRR